MHFVLRFDTIHTRIIFRTYSGVVGLAGFVLLGWGPLWLGSDLPGLPWGKAALIRVLGSILIAAACFAVPLADASARARRRALLWFGAGHGVVFLMLVLQREAIWGPGVADWALASVFAATLFPLYFGATAYGDPTGDSPWSPLISLFGGVSAPAAGELRSQYEQQIREAASHEERNRLARDLHDSVKQQVFIIQTAAATAQARFDDDPGGAKQALDEVRNSAREAMTEMEVMLDQLRAAPLENIGLVEALKKQCEALGLRSGAEVQFELGKLPPSESLAPGAQQAIFRAAQEALANVARHARAKNVLVTLGVENGLFQLTVKDNGAGFDPNQEVRGMGIANMRERAEEFGGYLTCFSRLGIGTRLGFLIPYAIPDPGRYLYKATIWGALWIFFTIVSIMKPSFPYLIVAVFSLTVLIRELIAYRRARKQSGTLS
jgi:signal transduction histidine kinase